MNIPQTVKIITEVVVRPEAIGRVKVVQVVQAGCETPDLDVIAYTVLPVRRHNSSATLARYSNVTSFGMGSYDTVNITKCASTGTL